MLGTPFMTMWANPLAQVAVLSPLLVLVLCVVAGVGTVLMLPGRREAGWRKIGAVVALAGGIIFALSLMRYAAGNGGGMGVYFWFFAIAAIVGGVRVITHTRPVYSALYFVLTVLASAGLFILLWAEFMAAALVLIYAGAILVTYVFVIMLAQQASPAQDGQTGLTGQAEYDLVSREPLAASAVGFALMGVLLLVIFDLAPGSLARQRTQLPVAEASQPTQALGTYLFQNQLVNLELAGVLLTVGMVGAIVIARRRVLADGRTISDEESIEAVLGPATPVDDNPHSIPVYGSRNPKQKEYPQS